MNKNEKCKECGGSGEIHANGCNPCPKPENCPLEKAPCSSCRPPQEKECEKCGKEYMKDGKGPCVDGCAIYCSCPSPTPSKTEGWRTELTNLLCARDKAPKCDCQGEDRNLCVACQNVEETHAFISSLIEKSRQEGREEVVEIVKQCTKYGNAETESVINAVSALSRTNPKQ